MSIPLFNHHYIFFSALRGLLRRMPAPIPGKSSWFASLDDFHRFLDGMSDVFQAPWLSAHKEIKLRALNTRFYAWLREGAGERFFLPEIHFLILFFF